MEQQPLSELSISPDEKIVMQHYKDNHFRISDGRFMVPLPKKCDVNPLGVSQSQIVSSFLTLFVTSSNLQRWML